ncbi:hypothetical protein F2P79_001127 [Pimephales promelas]|nr:hypothetical protein F2P79_001127 [Pimephales promelas]
MIRKLVPLMEAKQFNLNNQVFDIFLIKSVHHVSVFSPLDALYGIDEGRCRNYVLVVPVRCKAIQSRGQRSRNIL